MYQRSGEGLCLHGAWILLGPLPPGDISSALKPWSFILWIRSAGALCVLSGSDVFIFVL